MMTMTGLFDAIRRSSVDLKPKVTVIVMGAGMSDAAQLEYERERRGECPKCGAPNLAETGTQRVEESGSGFNREFGQTEHWWRGTITCAICGAEVDYADSSL